MIILDTSYLVIFLNNDPPVPSDRAGQPVKFFKERVANLIATLNTAGQIIGVPAPALAEVLVRAGAQRALFISILNDRLKFQILPFDSRSAIEASELIEKIKAETKGQRTETWAKVKFDTQIVAIAKANSATVIYSDDVGLEKSAKRLNIRVTRICDLPFVEPEIETKQEPVADVSGQQMNLLLSTTPATEREQAPQDSAKIKTAPTGISEENKQSPIAQPGKETTATESEPKNPSPEKDAITLDSSMLTVKSETESKPISPAPIGVVNPLGRTTPQ